MRRVLLALVGLFAASAAFAASEKTPMDDPYLWLEDVHGQKPLDWVKEQNAKSLGLLKVDPRYQTGYDFLLNVLDAQDRIPYGSLDHNHVYNFWQDAAHPKGIWRRTSVADYQKPQPVWEILIDLDKLAADEKENWVWKGADCSPSEKRCLINLSRGGGDAVVVREFDLASKSFVTDGFFLKEAKSDVALVDDDTVLFGTDFGSGSMTTSGYPRILKHWFRGEKIGDSITVYEGKTTDVSVSPTVLRNGDHSVSLMVQAPSFFEANYYGFGSDEGPIRIDVPKSARLQGLYKGFLLFTLREDWKNPWGGHFTAAKGSLISYAIGFPEDTTGLPKPPVSVIYTPGPRASIEGVATGRDAVYVSVLDNVIGSVHAFRFADGKWSDNKLALPPDGTASILSTNDFGPEALLGFESFLKPST
ncbi:MAG: hypothetical protein P4L57_08030, partial [Rhizomicrobium sp.]|nr:hypothetical protein [Rhizomicrobium sp.]